VYGHVLLEMILRLRLFQEFVRHEYKILVSDLAPPWVSHFLLEYLGIRSDQIEIYRPDVERLRLSTAIIPTQLHQTEHFHPAAKSLVNSLGQQIALSGSTPTSIIRRVVISRDRFSNKRSVQRSLSNAFELWDLLADKYGFTIVRPEELNWAEQVHIF